ncbi:MAG: tyrosine-type recombinase/integrase [Chlamydiales bacterium]
MGVFKRSRIQNNGSKQDYWYIRYWFDGHERKESIGKVGVVTKAVAQARLEERRRQVRLGQLDMLKAKIPTLEDFSVEYLEYQKDVMLKRSWKKDEAHLKNFNKAFGKMKLSEITAKHIDDYKLKRLKEGVKKVTVNRELEILRHLFFLAKKWKRFYTDNPVSESGLFKVESQRIRVLTYEEEDRLLACVAPHLLPVINAALLTGMRKGELLTLRWDDVNLDNGLITVRAEISKSKKNRRIPISTSLRGLLLEQKLKTIHSGYVFLTPQGRNYAPTNSNALIRIFTIARKNAHIENFTFHDLRHTAATRMAENGASIVAVKEILGHSDIKTTMKYFHPEKSLNEAVEILGNLYKDRTQNRTQQLSEKEE